MTIPDPIPFYLSGHHKVSLSGFDLRDLAFVFISVLGMVLLSSNVDPLFAQTAGENNSQEFSTMTPNESDSIISSNNKELENTKEKVKAMLINIFSKIFPQTEEKFSNSNYGVEIEYPKNWTGFEMKIVFPMAVVSPEGFKITDVFSPFVDSLVDNTVEIIISTNGTKISEQELRNLLESDLQETTEVLSTDLMEYLKNRTSIMGIFIFDKEFARLMNSIDPNNTIATDSLTSIYELLGSDPSINCKRESLNQITLSNNISAETSTEKCSYIDSGKIQYNFNYFVLTPEAIIDIQYTSDKNNENDKFLTEFEDSLKTLLVEESLPINNQTIQQFLSG